MGPADESHHGDETTSKVERVLRDYGLEELGSELERRWVGDGVERQSLRDLKDWLNARLVEEALERAGETPVAGEPENLYRLLTADDVGSSARVEAERTLERSGIAPERLRDQFVSHSTVHRYLREVRDASRDAARSDPSRADRARIDRLRGRLVAVTADTIERLRDTGHLNTPPAEPVAAVTVVCEACDASHPLDSFLERGGCDCDR